MNSNVLKVTKSEDLFIRKGPSYIKTSASVRKHDSCLSSGYFSTGNTANTKLCCKTSDGHQQKTPYNFDFLPGSLAGLHTHKSTVYLGDVVDCFGRNLFVLCVCLRRRKESVCASTPCLQNKLSEVRNYSIW